MTDHRDDMSPARGLINGFIISIAMWAILISVGLALFGCSDVVREPRLIAGSCDNRPDDCQVETFAHAQCAIWDNGSSCLVETRADD